MPNPTSPITPPPRPVTLARQGPACIHGACVPGARAQSGERGVGDSFRESKPGARHYVHVRGAQGGGRSSDYGDLQRPAADTGPPFDDRAPREVELEGWPRNPGNHEWYHNRDALREGHPHYPRRVSDLNPLTPRRIYDPSRERGIFSQ